MQVHYLDDFIEKYKKSPKSWDLYKLEFQNDRFSMEVEVRTREIRSFFVFINTICESMKESFNELCIDIKDIPECADDDDIELNDHKYTTVHDEYHEKEEHLRLLSKKIYKWQNAQPRFIRYAGIYDHGYDLPSSAKKMKISNKKKGVYVGNFDEYIELFKDYDEYGNYDYDAVYPIASRKRYERDIRDAKG